MSLQEHKKCTNLERNMEEVYKELCQLREQQQISDGGTMNQCTQTSNQMTVFHVNFSVQKAVQNHPIRIQMSWRH